MVGAVPGVSVKELPVVAKGRLAEHQGRIGSPRVCRLRWFRGSPVDKGGAMDESDARLC